MAKLQYIDHSRQHPVIAFYDFVSTSVDRSDYVCGGGVCSDSDSVPSFAGQIYSNFKENAEKHSFPLIHLLLSFEGENEINISVYELINISDVLAIVNGPQFLYRAIYQNDTGAEIHFLLNPVGFDTGLRSERDQLYITLWYCLQFFFDRPDAWDGHTKLQMEKNAYFEECVTRVGKEFLKPVEELMND